MQGTSQTWSLRTGGFYSQDVCFLLKIVFFLCIDRWYHIKGDFTAQSNLLRKTNDGHESNEAFSS